MWAAFKGLSIGGKLFILAAILALFGATYYVGYSRGTNISKVEIAEYEGKVATLDAKVRDAQGKVNVETVTRYLQGETVAGQTVYRTRTIVEKTVPEQFTFSNGWIYTYNQSVQGLETDENFASDPTPSGVTDKQALKTIVDNNASSLKNARQLDTLTGYLVEMEKVNEKVNGRPRSNDDERVR